jgi:hypothetical protein
MCYTQDGNDITFGGERTSSSDAYSTSSYFTIRILDNGKGPKATGPDLLGSFFGYDRNCGGTPLSLFWQIVRGDLKVH